MSLKVVADKAYGVASSLEIPETARAADEAAVEREDLGAMDELSEISGKTDPSPEGAARNPERSHREAVCGLSSARQIGAGAGLRLLR
jgi:hypothetical protein